MSGDGLSNRAPRRRVPTGLIVTLGLALSVVAVVGMAANAVGANRTVSVQRSKATVEDTALDNAFYHCLDVQVRSLVSPDQPVTLADPNLADFITLLKGVGGWVKVADPPGSAVAFLTLRDGVTGRDACLGTVAVATFHEKGGRTVVKIGSGASVPGSGPPPAPPL